MLALGLNVARRFLLRRSIIEEESQRLARKQAKKAVKGEA
jgi:hypothetical protein